MIIGEKIQANSSDPASLVLILLAAVGIGIFGLITVCCVYERAGRKWWEALIPYYNSYILAKYILKQNAVWTWLYTISPLITGFGFLINPYLGYLGATISLYFQLAVPMLLCKSFGYNKYFGLWTTLGSIFGLAAITLGLFFAVPAIIPIAGLILYLCSFIPYASIAFGNHGYLKNKDLLDF